LPSHGASYEHLYRRLGRLAVQAHHFQGWQLVTKAFSALGIGFGSYYLVLQPLLDWAITKWQSMPGDLASWLHALGIDVAISIILSAYGFKNTAGLILRKRES